MPPVFQEPVRASPEETTCKTPICLGSFVLASILACLEFWTENSHFAHRFWDQNDSSFAYIRKQVSQVFLVQIRDGPCEIKAV